MDVKAEKRLKEGDIIKWDVIVSGEYVDLLAYKNRNRKYKTVKLMVLKVYTNYILCRVLEPPYEKLCITNGELCVKGIYKQEDFINHD